MSENPLKELIESYLNDMEQKYPEIASKAKALPSDKPRKAVLKEQKPLTQTDIRTAMIYSKKELLQMRTSLKQFMKELSQLPTYQYIKPQVDNLISSVDDLEALLLNRFNEKQMKEQSPVEWEATQRLRQFFIRQLLEKYRK